MKPDNIILREIQPEQLLQAVRQIVQEELDKRIIREDPKKEKQQNDDESKTFRSSEAAAYLRIHRRTLYNRVREGKIEYSKDGHYLFTKKQLDEYLNNHKNK